MNTAAPRKEPERPGICNCPWERNPKTGKYERVPRADCPKHKGS